MRGYRLQYCRAPFPSVFADRHKRCHLRSADGRRPLHTAVGKITPACPFSISAPAKLPYNAEASDRRSRRSGARFELIVPGGWLSVRICVLGSGSKGNCTLIATERTRLLVDAGFSKRTVSAGWRRWASARRH